MKELIPEFLKNPIIWIVGGLLVFVGGRLSWSTIVDWVKSFFNKKTTTTNSESLESAVKHFIALKAHCKDNPEAKKTLDELWKHLLTTLKE